MQDVTVTERWTQERRRQHTRELLLDAAEEVFARRGFEGASLEEIAEAAGYTRGAIYKLLEQENIATASSRELVISSRRRGRIACTAASSAALRSSRPV